jgi:hypothetical protein
MCVTDIQNIIERADKNFPQISCIGMLEIWCKQLDMDYEISAKYNERETILEFANVTLEAYLFSSFLNLMKRIIKNSQRFVGHLAGI